MHHTRKVKIGQLQQSDNWSLVTRRHKNANYSVRFAQSENSDESYNRSEPSCCKKRHVNNRPHRLMKTSSIAVETLRSTTQSDSIVRQTNKRSSYQSQTCYHKVVLLKSDNYYFLIFYIEIDDTDYYSRLRSAFFNKRITTTPLILLTIASTVVE